MPFPLPISACASSLMKLGDIRFPCVAAGVYNPQNLDLYEFALSQTQLNMWCFYPFASHPFLGLPFLFTFFSYEPRCEANMDKMACVAYSSPWLKDQTWKVGKVSNMCPIDFGFHLVVVFNPSDKYSSIWWSSTTFTAAFHQAFRKASWVPCFQNSNQGLPLSQLQTANVPSKPEKCRKNVRSFIFGFCWHCITSQSRPPSTLWWAHCEKDESLVATWWHPYVWKWKASSSTWETLEATVEGHTPRRPGMTGQPFT